MTAYRQRLGEFGENLAGEFLKRRGYKIIFRNYRTRLGEIDLIAEKDKTLFFVEVKTRTTDEFGLPAEAVNRAKLSHLQRAVEIYLSEKRLEDVDWRLEAVSVEIDKKNNKAKIKLDKIDFLA